MTWLIWLMSREASCAVLQSIDVTLSKLCRLFLIFLFSWTCPVVVFFALSPKPLMKYCLLVRRVLMRLIAYCCADAKATVFMTSRAHKSKSTGKLTIVTTVGFFLRRIHFSLVEFPWSCEACVFWQDSFLVAFVHSLTHEHGAAKL